MEIELKNMIKVLTYKCFCLYIMIIVTNQNIKKRKVGEEKDITRL